jgi:hypothetical protein
MFVLNFLALQWPVQEQRQPIGESREETQPELLHEDDHCGRGLLYVQYVKSYQILYTPSKYGTHCIQCSTLHNIVYHNSSTTVKGCLTVLHDLNRSKHISVQWWKDQIRMCQNLYSFASIFLSWLDLVLLELFPELNKVNWWVMLWLFQCNLLKVRHLHVC